MNVFPITYYARGQHDVPPMEPSGTNPGMTIEQYYLGCILTGLVQNPTYMLDVDAHLAHAKKLAAAAARL